jgi:predicted phosphohydrolase
MRLHILSDIHLEFEPFAPPRTDADAVILAGDIGTGREGLEWALLHFPDRPVVYVLGNHEFYGEKVQSLIKNLKELSKGTNVHVLQNDAFTVGDVTFLGATLWTDFQLYGDPVKAETVALTGMNDYHYIHTLPFFAKLRPSDTRRFNMETRHWLEQQIYFRKKSKLVVVTHHSPCPKSICPVYEGDPFNPAFASEMTHFVEESGVKLWIHGHLHSRSDYMVGGTRILANPRGYPTEPRDDFQPGLVVEV